MAMIKNNGSVKIIHSNTMLQHKFNKSILILALALAVFGTTKTALAIDPVYQEVQEVSMMLSEGSGRNNYFNIGFGHQPGSPIYLKIEATNYSAPYISIYKRYDCPVLTYNYIVYDMQPTFVSTYYGGNGLLFYDLNGGLVEPVGGDLVIGDPSYLAFNLPVSITPDDCITIKIQNDPSHYDFKQYGGILGLTGYFTSWVGGTYTISPTNFAPFYFNSLGIAPPAPTIDVSYPTNGQQISTKIYITGSVQNQGDWSVVVAHLFDSTTNADVYSYGDFIGTLGAFSFPLSGIPAGTYDLKFQLANLPVYSEWIDPGIQITILSNIPPEIGGEPATPGIGVIDPATWICEHSAYGCTATAFYTTITGTIAPLLGALGNWGQSFQEKFSQADAVANGTNIGNSLALVRVYSTNINSLFNNFPVSQAIMVLLVWYLALAVLTAIRFIVKLIK